MNDANFNNNFRQEAQQLEFIQTWLKRELERLERELDELSEKEIQLKASSWDDRLDLKNSANTADNAVAQQDLRQLFGRRQTLQKQIAEYKWLEDRPYFGKLVFSYEGESREEAESYYIGLRSLYDSEAVESLVLDWRSPLASLYYDAEPGPVTIKGPHGPIQGTLWKKQMLTINKGHLLKVSDFDQASSDDLLRDILSQAASPELKEIAASLQKGQNALIRLPEHQSLLVWGVAGSGKSSVAIHRAAWLLYRQRFSAKRILFVSPSKLFADYVSLALPALGEESLSLATLVDLAKDQLSLLAPKLASYSYAEASPERLAWAANSSLSQVLASFAQALAPQLARLEDLEPSSSPADQTEFADYEGDLEGQELEQLPAVTDSPVKPDLDLDKLYREFLASPALKASLPGLYEREVFRRYDRLDLIILARLSLYLGGRPSHKPYYFLIVDESQDLLPLEHEFLAASFSCPTNLFGDPSQAIRFPLPADYTTNLLASYKIQTDYVFELKTSYRSTFEIMDFARKIIQDPDLLPFPRHGEAVQLEKVEEASWLPAARQALADFYKRGRRRLALICRDLAETQQRASELLEQSPEIFATEEGSYEVAWPSFPWPEYLAEASVQGSLSLYILPARQTKGLEFDAVLLSDVSKSRYPAPQDDHLLYLASTRALHELHLLYEGEVSKLLTEA
ncbi:MAG: AAA family ATPase [Eubacteriales bacterium]|nr:AAA family ATPase [Eubacteriales bacterium]